MLGLSRTEADGVVERLARKHIADQVPDPELREKVTPDYTIGCKRILPPTSGIRPSASDNVELVTGGAAEVRENSIVGADGVEREVDAIIYGTGFHVADMPAASIIRGRDGRSLDETWGGGPSALWGSTVPGFPNFFFLLGPSTGGGHSSVVYMSEAQMTYVIEALRAMDREGRRLSSARPEAVERSIARSTAGWRGRSGTAVARAGTSTRPGETRCCGRIGPFASATALPSSTSATTRCTRRRPATAKAAA